MACVETLLALDVPTRQKLQERSHREKNDYTNGLNKVMLIIDYTLNWHTFKPPSHGHS